MPVAPPYDWAGTVRAVEMTAPHRKWGMTRPWFLILVAVTVVVTVFAALAAASLVAWVAWSLGGILIGSLFVTFDSKARKRGR